MIYLIKKIKRANIPHRWLDSKEWNSRLDLVIYYLENRRGRGAISLYNLAYGKKYLYDHSLDLVECLILHPIQIWQA